MYISDSLQSHAFAHVTVLMQLVLSFLVVRVENKSTVGRLPSGLTNWPDPVAVFLPDRFTRSSCNTCKYCASRAQSFHDAPGDVQHLSYHVRSTLDFFSTKYFPNTLRKSTLTDFFLTCIFLASTDIHKLTWKMKHQASPTAPAAEPQSLPEPFSGAADFAPSSSCHTSLGVVTS